MFVLFKDTVFPKLQPRMGDAVRGPLSNLHLTNKGILV